MKVEMIESYIRRDGGYCPKMIGTVSEDDYCSKAERIENDN